LLFLKTKLSKIKVLDNYFYSLNGGFYGGEAPKPNFGQVKPRGLINRVGGLNKL